MDANKELIKEIIEGILDFKIIPFLGAGMSKPFGFKDWDELVLMLKSELTTDETDNLKVAQLYENAFGREALIGKLKESYQIENIEKLNTDNQQLILAMNPPIIYTTNYDEGIELTGSMISRPYYKIACLKDIVEMPHAANIVVKFHGDFSADQEIVLTENDFQKRMKIENPLDIIFRSHLLGKKIFFMGYGLRDRNIDFIFKRHSALYGIDNLLHSYIIIFNDSNAAQRQQEFKDKGINTIILESPEELHQLVKEVNEEVFRGDFNRQVKDMFKPYPKQVLLETEFESLKIYWEDKSHTENEKAQKTEETLSLKIIPEPLQESVSAFLLKLFENTALDNTTIETLLRTFNYTEVDPKLNIDTGTAIVRLTARPYFNRGANRFNILHPLQSVEHKFKNEGTVVCIFLYLIDCYQKQKKLPQEQLSDLIYVLKACRYNVHEFGEALPKEMREEVLNHFISQYPGWKPMSTIFKPSSLTDIHSGLLKMMPEKFKDKF